MTTPDTTHDFAKTFLNEQAASMLATGHILPPHMTKSFNEDQQHHPNMFKMGKATRVSLDQMAHSEVMSKAIKSRKVVLGQNLPDKDSVASSLLNAQMDGKLDPIGGKMKISAGGDSIAAASPAGSCQVLVKPAASNHPSAHPEDPNYTPREVVAIDPAELRRVVHVHTSAAVRSQVHRYK